MIRKLQGIGFVGLAICALGALGAAPASAEFHSSVEHTTLDGKQVGTDSLVFNAGKISCTSITYSGTQSAKTSSTASLTPAYSGCNAFGFIGVTIDVNGCQLVLHTSTELTDVSCGEKPITVTGPNCTLTIGTQTGLTSSTFSTEGTAPKRDVKAKLALTGLKYKQTGSGGTPCTTKEFTDGTYTAEITITGTNTTGSQVDFVTDPPPQPGAHGPFNSSEAHTILDGSQAEPEGDITTFNAGTFQCNAVFYSGTAASSQETTLSLAPTYASCAAFGFVNTEVKVNGCQYVLDGSSAIQFSCPGSPMEISSFSCRVTIGSQGLAGGTYTNSGETPKRDIYLHLNISGVKYTQDVKTFPGCSGGTGSFSNGTFIGAATIIGTDTNGSQVDLWKT